MDGILKPQHRISAINKSIFASSKQTLALMPSLVASMPLLKKPQHSQQLMQETIKAIFKMNLTPK